jgi:hypothetical protein
VKLAGASWSRCLCRSCAGCPTSSAATGPAIARVTMPHRMSCRARSEWSPGVLAGAFSGAAVRDCSALTERHLNAFTERDVRAGCRLLVVERVVDRVPCTPGAFCAS